MSHKPSPNATGFAAVGALLVAIKLAPDPTASDVVRFYGHVGAGLFGASAAVLAIQAIRAAEPRPSPWPSLIGRLAWALRPRGFMVAWALIIAAAAAVGTPHAAVRYPPATIGYCDYAGLKGIVRVPGGDCPWWRWL